MSVPCAFCEIAAGRAPAAFVYTWPDALAFIPLDPVAEGHTLIIPRAHVTDAVEDPDVSADVMRRACQYARELGNLNVITSVGPDATQTVYHLHLHVVPRAENDGLALPWRHEGRTSE